MQQNLGILMYPFLIILIRIIIICISASLGALNAMRAFGMIYRAGAGTLIDVDSVLCSSFVYYLDFENAYNTYWKTLNFACSKESSCTLATFFFLSIDARTL